MNTNTQHPSLHLALGLYSGGLLLFPLVFPGLWDTSSDLLPKRMLLYSLGFGIAASWLWATLSRVSFWPRVSLILPSISYVLINLLSIFWSTNPFSGWVESVQLLTLLLFFFGLITLLHPKHFLTLAQFSSLSGFFVSLVGIAQYLGLGFNSIPSVGLPSSTFIYRNFAAAYLIGNLPFGFFAFLSDPIPRRKLIWGIATGSMLLFLFYTRSRGAFVGLFGAIFLSGILLLIQKPLRQTILTQIRSTFSPPTLRWSMVLFTIFLLYGTTLPTQPFKKVIQNFDEKKSSPITTINSIFSPNSDRGRLAMWNHTLTMITDQPIFGVGLDNWEFIYPLYDKGDKITNESEPVRPHNDFLWIASELGLIGFGLFIYLLFNCARTILTLIQTNSPETQLASFVCMVGLIGLLGYSLFSFPKEQPTSAILFWLHLSLLGLLSTQKNLQSTTTARFTWIVPFLALLFSAGAIHLNWQQIVFDKHYHRAKAYQEAGLWQEAYEEISLSLKRGNFDHRARFLLGLVLHRSGKHEKAELAYQQALEIHPNYSHTHNNLGLVYTSQKKWTKAINSYQKAVKIRPNYYQARINLGKAYESDGNLNLAEKEFKKVIQNPNYSTPTFPGRPDALTNLGAIYLKQGNLDIAISTLKKAIQLRPNNALAFNNLAYAYEKKGLYSKASDAYQNFLKYWKGNEAYAETVRHHLNSIQDRFGE